MDKQSFKIFRASPEHIDMALQAIVDVHKRAHKDREALQFFLSNPNSIMILACQDDHVIGSLNGYALPHPHRCEPQFLLYEIDVKPEHQKKGIGQALVNKFVDLAHDAGAFEVWVLSNESNQAAMEMYQKCGFQRRNDDDVMLSRMLETNAGEK